MKTKIPNRRRKDAGHPSQPQPATVVEPDNVVAVSPAYDEPFNDLALLPMRGMVAVELAVWKNDDAEFLGAHEWSIADWKLLKAAAAEQGKDLAELVNELLSDVVLNYARSHYRNPLLSASEAAAGAQEEAA